MPHPLLAGNPEDTFGKKKGSIGDNGQHAQFLKKKSEAPWAEKASLLTFL
ncbi:MAG: hypothetical protein LBJ70_00375 [Holosporales bacterium]|nr:hypothetical protein [Holosporales bacterium]